MIVHPSSVDFNLSPHSHPGKRFEIDAAEPIRHARGRIWGRLDPSGSDRTTRTMLNGRIRKRIQVSQDATSNVPLRWTFTHAGPCDDAQKGCDAAYKARRLGSFENDRPE
ncbi:Uncharacterized protein HZ326_16815 [Fusarium oxysporum f. sp. albedinis]|nr:Uncharacterized protein HZ326_16815 [Fusarium oxysporum f. sp. albedinis]